VKPNPWPNRKERGQIDLIESRVVDHGCEIGEIPFFLTKRVELFDEPKANMVKRTQNQS
jgi:hypothetical protein